MLTDLEKRLTNALRDVDLDNTSIEDFIQWLEKVVRYRETSGAVRHMRPEYANKCAGFVENLVSRLNRVVYGP